ncbi:Tex family protein [Terriglobus albidus]|uniref:Tex family protein n=1 Tax=Terriglobus albidus TaxID=1592106 RepID=UPI0021DFF09F|nr:Tex family protein [Terriglobus albidus]
MAESKFPALALPLLQHISNELNVPLRSLVAVIELLDDGGTVPFIARYRKEATGNLDEVQIRSIEERVTYFRELVSRRETVLASITEQGKLTGDLRARIEAAMDKSELEDLYLPYRPKRRTKATIAREAGLEPLADYLWAQQRGEEDLVTLAATFVDTEKGVADIEAALEGARHIVAERISEDADLRKELRQVLFDEGIIVSRKVMELEGDAPKDPQEKFKMYYDYKEPVKTIPSHRMLAVRRGEEEGVLYFLIESDQERILALLKARVLRDQGDWTSHMTLALEDAWTRLMKSSIQSEIRLELKRRSDKEAIEVFRENLHHLLLAPPAGPLAVLGIDPGLRTGCKLAVVDETGKFLAHDVMYPHTGKAQVEQAKQKVAALLKNHNVRAIAIGNGTASRETDQFVREFLREHHLNTVFSVTVSESGASVYSASDIARQEFPDLDLTVRGAISIARRLQDPLSELVKVDPKAIGVGQYQHDVDQKLLQESLEHTIESCVNRVGVDLNTASWTLLRYVSGISERTAQSIVSHRDNNGKFVSRQQLLEVSGVGPKTFEQAAGFLRIRGGVNPLDSTAVHPESYRVVEQIASAIGTPIEDVIKNPQLLEKVDRSRLDAGAFTLNDILEELRKPGRDPREKFVAPSFAEGVNELSDLQEGMVLEGVVTNVTKFGAFVDVGVHQDGLVHISELSNKFIKDPHEAVKTGQIVKVKVLGADEKTRRISLSIKQLEAPAGPKVKNGSVVPSGSGPNRTAGGARPPAGKPRPSAPAPLQTMEEKLAALSGKWKTR